MHLIRHDLYVKLLRDDAEWKKLIAEQRAEAFQLANEAAAAREQSLTTLWNSSKMEVDQLKADLEEANNLLGAALRTQDELRQNQDLNIRTTALTHAVHLATTGATVHVPTEARAMEAFLRGQASVEGEAALVNSGWNSLIEMLLTDLQNTDSDLYQMVGSHNQANTARVIEGLKR